MRDLTVEGDLAYRALGDTGVGYDIALLVRLELLDGVDATVAVAALGFVDAAVRAGGDEAEDGVLVGDSGACAVPLGAIVAHGICVNRWDIHDSRQLKLS